MASQLHHAVYSRAPLSSYTAWRRGLCSIMAFSAQALALQSLGRRRGGELPTETYLWSLNQTSSLREYSAGQASWGGVAICNPHSTGKNRKVDRGAAGSASFQDAHCPWQVIKRVAAQRLSERKSEEKWELNGDPVVSGSWRTCIQHQSAQHAPVASIIENRNRDSPPTGAIEPHRPSQRLGTMRGYEIQEYSS